MNTFKFDKSFDSNKDTEKALQQPKKFSFDKFFDENKARALRYQLYAHLEEEKKSSLYQGNIAKFKFNRSFDDNYDSHLSKGSEGYKEGAYFQEAMLYTEQDISDAESRGHNLGYAAGVDDGLSEGLEKGFSDGYANGIDDANQAIAGYSLAIIQKINAQIEQLHKFQRAELQIFCSDLGKIALSMIKKLFPYIEKSQGFNEVCNFLELNLLKLVKKQNIIIKVNHNLLALIQEHVNAVIAKSDNLRYIEVTSAPNLELSDCLINWEDGGVARLTEQILKEIEMLVQQHLPAIDFDQRLTEFHDPFPPPEDSQDSLNPKSISEEASENAHPELPPEMTSVDDHAEKAHNEQAPGELEPGEPEPGEPEPGEPE